MLPAGRDVADDDGDAEQAGEPGGAPAALAGDDLKAIAGLAHDDRLDDAVRLDRLRELLQSRIVGGDSRLKLVRREAIDIRFDRRRARLGCVGNERAEAFAKRGAFVHIEPTSNRGDRGESQRTRRPSQRQPAAHEDTNNQERELESSSWFRAFVVAFVFQAAVAAERSSTSRARARYASAPRDFTSYRITGIPWLGASPRRTLRGMTVRKTFSLKNCRTSLATCCPRLVRSSNIVRSTPSMSSAGLSAARTRRIVPTRSARPSSAKYSQCSGINTASAATSAFSVSRPSDGGQSTKM